MIVLASCQRSKVDLVVYNATIHAVDSANTTYQAMAIREGRIVELGTEQAILDDYAARERYDAKGGHIYPGFIDGHCHFYSHGLNTQKVDLHDARSWDEILHRTVAFAEEHPKREWIIGRGWDQNLWGVKEYPDNARLSELFPNRPVLLQRVDGHTVIVNQAALDRMHLNVDDPIEGGFVVKRNGIPTGVLTDNAADRFQGIFDEADEETQRQALLDAQTDCLEAGLTMVCDAGLDTGTIGLMRRMHAEGALKIRVYAMINDKAENRAYFAEHGPILEERLIARSMKSYVDGSLGARSALLKQPYSDKAGHYGVLISPREHFVEVAQWCKQHGFQMNTHCIGDSANALMLDVYGEVLGGTNSLRWRVEHVQVISPEDLPKFKQYSLVPSVQPVHATSDGRWAGGRLGPVRIGHGYAYKDIHRITGILAFGTNFPVERIDPLQTFRSAVLRSDIPDPAVEGYHLENALSRLVAIRGMTIWNAVATFTEKDLGSLEAGKYADFVVLDHDLLTATREELWNMRVVATAVNGEFVKK